MASGGLYFNYLHQQFTVLINHLCTLDAALLYVVNREGVTTSSRAGTDISR